MDSEQRPEGQNVGSNSLLGDVCLRDGEELREIAAYFEQRGIMSNGKFLRAVADRYEILAGAYRTSTARYERELQEWVSRPPTGEEKKKALRWLEGLRNGDNQSEDNPEIVVPNASLTGGAAVPLKR